MRRLIVFLLILLASVWIGVEVMRHPGQLLIIAHPWLIEMPLWFAVLAFLIFIVLFYLIIDSIDRLQFLWFRFKNWLRFRREHRLYNKTQHGLTLIIEGRWKKAERLLLAGINESVDPLMNYLGAAKAAQELGAYARREEYIKKAYQVAPHAVLAIGLTEAELQLSHEQVEQAIVTLTQLRQTSPRHPRVLRLLEKAYTRLAQWQSLLNLLPSMRKAKVVNAEQYSQFEKNMYAEILHAAKDKNLAEIQQMWADMPRHVRRNPDVVLAYVKELLRFSDTKDAEELIRKTLKNYWQPELVRIYGMLPFVNLNRQLVVVGAWLKMYGEKQETLLTLGRLCVRVQLWGKAKSYFERCLDLGPDVEASLAYGQLLEQLGEHEGALQIYREALHPQRGLILISSHPHPDA